MKIGIMLRHLDQHEGGVKVYTKKLLSNMLSMDTENTYILMYKEEKHIGTYSKHMNVSEASINLPGNIMWDQIAVPYMAWKYKVDLIFNPKLSVPLFTSKKTAFVLHGADWFVFPKNYKFLDRLYHRIFALLYCKKADLVISVSQNATNEIIRHLKIQRKKLKTVHHGVGENFQVIRDENRLKAVREKYNLPGKFILYVGQIYPMKNFSGIVRSYSQIRNKIPHKLIIVGKATLKYEKEVALIDELGLSNYVTRVGVIPDEDLPVFYNLAELFLFPSLYEGFGIPLLEAMACGCPVVTSNRGSCPEVVGDAASIVDPYDIADISNAIYLALTDRVLRDALIEKGLLRVKDFTWESTAKNTLSALTRL